MAYTTGTFWIATAWLAAGLYIAPYICGYEPKYQKLGVDVLFGALHVVVLGSMAGQWMSVMHMLDGDLCFGSDIKAMNMSTLDAFGRPHCSSDCCCGCS